MMNVGSWLRKYAAVAVVISPGMMLTFMPGVGLAAVVWGNPAGNYRVGIDSDEVNTANTTIFRADWEACTGPGIWTQSGTPDLVAGLVPEPTDSRCSVTVVWEGMNIHGANASGPFSLSVADGQATMTPSAPTAELPYTVTLGSYDDTLEVVVFDIR